MRRLGVAALLLATLPAFAQELPPPELQASASHGVIYYRGHRFAAPLVLSFSRGALVVNGWTVPSEVPASRARQHSARSTGRFNLDRQVLKMVRDRLFKGSSRARALQDARDLYAASPLGSSAEGDSAAIAVLYADEPGMKYIKLFPPGMPLRDPTPKEIASKEARGNADRLRALKDHLDSGGLIIDTGTRTLFVPPSESGALDKALARQLSGQLVTADEDAAITAAIPSTLRMLVSTKSPLVMAKEPK